ncbi:MAG TPA: dihydropteroate synthase [Candidatus Edwardsbacteria bacterium]|nr:dihydropteroate synthase [Candidatus Edwardsbacteria bacterium]
MERFFPVFTLPGVLSFITVRPLDVLDILLVAYIIYRVIHLMKGTRAIQMLFGILALVVGASRKSFIGAVNDGIPAQQRLPGSLAAAIAAWRNGAAVLRVHDVAETKQALTTAHAIEKAE